MNDSRQIANDSSSALVHIPERGGVPSAAAAAPPASAFLRRNWVAIGTVGLVGAILAVAGSYQVEKVYRAEVLVAPVSTQDNSSLGSLIGKFGEMAGIGGMSLGQDEKATAATVAILKSRAFIERFIVDRNLLPVLFWRRWDAEHGRWKRLDRSPAPTLQDGYELFKKKVLLVTQDRQTQLITVRVDWRNSAVAADWANALVARVNDAARAREIKNADLSVQYLDAELQRAPTVELRQSIALVLQDQITKKMLAATRPEFALSILDPGQAAEPKRFVWPIRWLFALLGCFAGGLLAMLSIAMSPHLPAWAAGSKRWRPVRG